jgi:hypothetical protein
MGANTQESIAICIPLPRGCWKRLPGLSMFAARQYESPRAVLVACQKLWLRSAQESSARTLSIMDMQRSMVFDFVSDRYMDRDFAGIVTNPPYGPRGKLAELFIEHGILRMGYGFLALLLPADFDSARTRMHLFGDCGQFAGKLTLTRRVKWFEHPTNPRMQPRENSAWYLWGNVDLHHLKTMTPVIHYAPRMAA